MSEAFKFEFKEIIEKAEKIEKSINSLLKSKNHEIIQNKTEELSDIRSFAQTIRKNAEYLEKNLL